ncbi:hypothetical protein BB561_002573 [Smittium simulii]|uniref:Uncharacterized protein n=1 Tax=Smittium simulii TaxID=133385 RepID=A0A2T9YQ13_9FUNG|nr:hypothetical protein BB561_002573 [Smittium simulii]
MTQVTTNPGTQYETILVTLIQAAQAFYINDAFLKTDHSKELFLSICSYGNLERGQICKIKNILKKCTNKATLLYNSIEMRFKREESDINTPQEELAELRRLILSIKYEKVDFEPERTSKLELTSGFTYISNRNMSYNSFQLQLQEAFLLDFSRELDPIELSTINEKQDLLLNKDFIVDFEFGTRYFLSIHILIQEQFERQVSYGQISYVLEQWLLFLTRNSVIPKYDNDIQKSLQIVKLAAIQVPKIIELSQILPGKLNQIFFERLVLKNDDSPDFDQLDSNDHSVFINSLDGIYVVESKSTDIVIKNTILPFTALACEYDRDKNVEIGATFELTFDKEIIKQCIPKLIIECTLYTLNNKSKFINSVTSKDDIFSEVMLMCVRRR